jgi:hypothetical protein
MHRNKAAIEGYMSNKKNTIGAAFARQRKEKPPPLPTFDERERWQQYFDLTTMPPCEMVKLDPLIAARTMALRGHFRRLLDGSTKMGSYQILADDLQLSERQARRVLDVFVDNEKLLQSAQGRYVRRLNVFNNEEVLEQFQSHCAQQEERLDIDLLCAELNDNIIPAVYSNEDQAKMRLVSFTSFAYLSCSQVFYIWSTFFLGSLPMQTSSHCSHHRQRTKLFMQSSRSLDGAMGGAPKVSSSMAMRERT